MVFISIRSALLSAFEDEQRKALVLLTFDSFVYVDYLQLPCHAGIRKTVGPCSGRVDDSFDLQQSFRAT